MIKMSKVTTFRSVCKTVVAVGVRPLTPKERAHLSFITRSYGHVLSVKPRTFTAAQFAARIEARYSTVLPQNREAVYFLRSL